MSTNEHTGARLVSRVPDKDYLDGWDRIFGKKPSCLDSAYERKAMKDGMCSKPVFEENKIERYIQSQEAFLKPIVDKTIEILKDRNLIKDNEKVEND